MLRTSLLGEHQQKMQVKVTDFKIH